MILNRRLVKHIIFFTQFLIIISMIFAGQTYAADSPFTLPPDAHSASYSDGAFSPILNPVFTDVSGHPLLAYRYAANFDQENGNHFFMIKPFGFSVIYTWYDHIYVNDTKSIEEIKSNYYNISKGFFFNDVFGFGIGYSFSNSDNRNFDGYSSWTFGFLYRPLRFLSLGISLRDINAEINDQSIKSEEIYSVSIRPFSDYITISADFPRMEGENFSKNDITFSGEVRLKNDIAFYFKSDWNFNLAFGVRIPIFFRSGTSQTVMFDSYASSSKTDPPNGLSIGISIPYEKNESAISVAGNNFLMIRINRKIKENELRQFFKKRNIVFYNILDAVKQAGEDKTINGIILQVDSGGLGFAQIQELRNELKRFKKTGRKVYSIMTTPGNREYYLCSVADKIYFTPNSLFYLTGLKAEVYFFKGLLDKVGVKFESVKRGKYKSFSESFSRTTMSKEFRENLTSLLSDLNAQFINDISTDRGISESRFEELFSNGGLSPEEAQNNRFIDEVKYPDEAVKHIGKDVSIVSLENYVSEVKKNHIWSALPSVAILYLNGSIIRGKSSPSRYVDTIGDETYNNMLKNVFRDRSVKAVVIRVSSGGGSAAASDFMLNYLVKLKKKYKKPVIFSFGNIAASGGYYVACTGDKIYASRGSVVGSIGVVSGKISAKELYEKLGINKEVIKMSEFADIYSESRDITDKERQFLQKGVDFIYDRFTGKVMEARGISKEELPKIAEGRVFNGNQGMNNQLINEAGGLMTAIEFALARAEISGQYKIIELPNQVTYFTDMLESADGKLISEYLKILMKNVKLIKFKDEKALYLFPYEIEIK